MNHETLSAYMATLYRIHAQPAIDMRIGETNPDLAALLALHRVESAVFVTAFNPFSRRLSDEQNAARQLKLLEYLERLRLATIEGVGIDPAGEWPAETSLLALGATEATGDELMQAFEQNAVVFVDTRGSASLLFHPQLPRRPAKADENASLTVYAPRSPSVYKNTTSMTRPTPATSDDGDDSPGPVKQRIADVEVSLYRTLVQEIEDCAIFLLSPEGRVRTWNAGARRIKGYAADEIIGEHFSRFYPQEALARGWPDHELREALAHGRFEDEGWRVRKDGSLFWANVVITALRDPSGMPIGFAKLTRDLTARRQEEERLRESEERFRLLVESVKDYAIFMLDPDGRVASWNTGAIEIKGYRPAEIIGQHFSVFYRPEDNAAGKPAYELAMARRFGRVEDEGWRVRKDGSMFWANVVITAVHDSTGLLRGYAKVTRDLSQRKRLEELERSSQHVSEFLATLAHELRNPLAPLRNAVGVMQLESVSPTLASCRDMIDRQTVQLSRLVDDLLDMGRITTGKIELRTAPIDMAAVVAHSVEAVRPLADQRNQVIDIDMPEQPVIVEGDFVRLVQVLQNLLNNASKFSPTGARIAVRIESEARNVVMRVSDPGRGISPDALETVFTLFAQEDRLLDPTHNGLGIGLTLCRSLVELHGGVITAASEGRGKGSTFNVRLPRARHRAGNGGPQPSRPAMDISAGALRVLVIDDNRDSADSLAMLIGMMGHEARAAYGGAQGVAIAREFVPQLVLIDLAMPDMDGFAVLHALRANPLLVRTMTAAMTGFGQNQDRERSMLAGFDVHLVKPVEMALLDDLLARAKRRHHAGDASWPVA